MGDREYAMVSEECSNRGLNSQKVIHTHTFKQTRLNLEQHTSIYKATSCQIGAAKYKHRDVNGVQRQSQLAKLRDDMLRKSIIYVSRNNTQNANRVHIYIYIHT